MKAKDIMTSPVVSVEPDASVLQAVRIMLQRRMSGLPVVDREGRLIGIVTEGDFLRRAETGTQRRRARWLEFLLGPGRLADEYTQSHGRKVSEIMTRDPHTVTEDTPLEDVVRLMEKKQAGAGRSRTACRGHRQSCQPAARARGRLSRSQAGRAER